MLEFIELYVVLVVCNDQKVRGGSDRKNIVFRVNFRICWNTIAKIPSKFIRFLKNLWGIPKTTSSNRVPWEQSSNLRLKCFITKNGSSHSTNRCHAQWKIYIQIHSFRTSKHWKKPIRLEYSREMWFFPLVHIEISINKIGNCMENDY